MWNKWNCDPPQITFHHHPLYRGGGGGGGFNRPDASKVEIQTLIAISIMAEARYDPGT